MEVEMNSSAAQFHHHHHHHHQEMTSQTLESMLVSNNNNNKSAADNKKPRPPDQSALNCPRCDSTNTKFCYYNNYSLTQPRYFCKSCRRYWTKGGTLRNVPVGGGCRKSTKRPSSSSSTSNSPTSSSSSKRLPSSSSSLDLIHHQPFITNPILSHHLPNYLNHDGSSTTTTDLSLAFARLQSQANAGFDFDHEHFLGANSQNTPNGDHFLGNGGGHHSFLDALRGGFLENGNPNGLFHNMYTSYGDQNQMGNVENGGILGLSNVSTDNQDNHLGMNINGPLYRNEDHHHQMASSGGAGTTAVTVTTVKQESCNGREVGGGGGGGGERSESRVLWGFPWQIGGSDHQAGGNVVHEVDSGRSQIGGANWNGFGSTNWHGLLNSPLM